MERIVVFTCVYNGENTIAQTIESVLQQTYSQFEYYIVENGSTDGTRRIIEKYAKKDSRIILELREKNSVVAGEISPFLSFMQFSSKLPNRYITIIDGDDWWEATYLEKLVTFAEKYDLDIACTGTRMHHMETGTGYDRSVTQPILLKKRMFADGYPFYHVFFRTTWNKLIRTNSIPEDLRCEEIRQLYYGMDTALCFRILRHANRIGIDNSVLHHYRVSDHSLSYQYYPERFDSDVYLYDDALDFLRPYGSISQRNQLFLDIVYANAVADTLRVLGSSSLSPKEKLQECRRIAEHPYTLSAYQRQDEQIRRSEMELRRLILQERLRLPTVEDCDDFQAVATLVFPNCRSLVVTDFVQLILLYQPVLIAVIEDDLKKLLTALMDIIEKQEAKQFDLGALLNDLLPDSCLLKGETDSCYYQTYAESCRLLMDNSLESALEQMTGMLLESDKLYAEDRFLKLYLSIAALQNQIPAFLYGNIRLAYLCFNEERYDECHTILRDLEEMGVREHEDVLALRRALESVS